MYDPIRDGLRHLLRSATLAEELGAEGITVHSHFNVYKGNNPPSEDETIDKMFEKLSEFSDEHPDLKIHLENFGAGWVPEGWGFRPDEKYVTSPLDFMQFRIINKVARLIEEHNLNMGFCLDFSHVIGFCNMVELKRRFSDPEVKRAVRGHEYKFSNITEEDVSKPTPRIVDFVRAADKHLSYLHVGDSFRWDGELKDYEAFESKYVRNESLPFKKGNTYPEIIEALRELPHNDVVISVELDVDHKNPVEMEEGIRMLTGDLK
jgi:sugar phosphate isomerase/epimerase